MSIMYKDESITLYIYLHVSFRVHQRIMQQISPLSADTSNSENRTSLRPQLSLGRFNSDRSRTRVPALKEIKHM